MNGYYRVCVPEAVYHWTGYGWKKGGDILGSCFGQVYTYMVFKCCGCRTGPWKTKSRIRRRQQPFAWYAAMPKEWSDHKVGLMVSAEGITNCYRPLHPGETSGLSDIAHPVKLR